MSRPSQPPGRPAVVRRDHLLADTFTAHLLERLDTRYAEFNTGHATGLIIDDVRQALEDTLNADESRRCGKVQYGSKRQADRAGRRIPGYTRAYHHAPCNAWHLTSKPLAHGGPC